MEIVIESNACRVEKMYYATHIRNGDEYPSDDTVVRIYNKITSKMESFVEIKAFSRLQDTVDSLEDKLDNAERLAQEWEHRAELRYNVCNELQAENDMLKAQIRLIEIRAKNKSNNF